MFSPWFTLDIVSLVQRWCAGKRDPGSEVTILQIANSRKNLTPSCPQFTPKTLYIYIYFFFSVEDGFSNYRTTRTSTWAYWV